MYKFSKIPQFRDVVREAKNLNIDQLRFYGSPKVHGTNSSVVYDVKDKSITYQSRNRIITLEDDNAGFVAAQIKQEDQWKQFFKTYLTELLPGLDKQVSKVVVYGEWFGPGIHKGVGVNKLSEKWFMIFSVKFVYEDETTHSTDCSDIGYYGRLISSIDVLKNVIVDFLLIEINIDFDDLAETLLQLKMWTLEVEDCCPVASKLGVVGEKVGEGIVWTASHEDKIFRFKTKGQKHSATKVKTVASVDIEKFAIIQDFVNSTVTENRIQQGLDYLKEMNIEINKPNTGKFVKWVVDDILTEERDTIETNGFDIKLLKREISKNAANYFLREV